MIQPATNNDELFWSLTSETLAGNITVPPFNSTFKQGLLVYPDRDFCVGKRNVPEAHGAIIGLCEVLEFSVSYGNLMRTFLALPLLNGLTFPVITMLFGLPFRLYWIALCLPICGMIYQIVWMASAINWSLIKADAITQEGVSLSAHHEFLYYSMFTLIVYVSCVVAALSSERYSRSLFSIRRVLQDQRSELVSQRDKVKSVFF